MQKFAVIIFFLVFTVSFVSGQEKFVSELEKNLETYQPKYINVEFENLTFPEYLYPRVMISDEDYELSQNAIAYFDQICKLSETAKRKILSAHAELKYVADIQGLENFPKQLLWLPFAISSFDTDYNLEGNCGIWGLQYLYAIKYGVGISECFDERQDIKFSTKAAISQLQYNINKFEKWDNALAAYLFGASNLVRMQKQNIETSKIYTSLDPYGKNVFDIWCALISWAKNYEKTQINISEVKFNYYTVQICERMHIEQISKVLNINLEELKSINSTFHCEVIDGRKNPITFNLPANRKSDFLLLRDSIAKYNDSIYFPAPKLVTDNDLPNPDKYGKITYKIQSGDYLGKIAEKFHVKVSDIQKWNNLNGTNISAGKTLIIYTPKASSSNSSTKYANHSKQTTSGPPAGYELVETYTVKSGDSPYTIAKKYPWATADEIARWNNISDPSKLQIGQKLKIYRKK